MLAVSVDVCVGVHVLETDPDTELEFETVAATDEDGDVVALAVKLLDTDPDTVTLADRELRGKGRCKRM